MTNWWPKRKPGRVGQALRDSLRAAGRDAARSGDVWTALAISTADLVDGARIAEDPKMFLTASKELRALLPLAGLGGGELDAAGSGELDVERDDLADELGAGPEMGHPS